MVNLASFVDESLQIELAKESAVMEDVAARGSSALKKLKWPAIVGGAYLGGKQIEQAVKDLSIGRQVRKQYEGQGQ
jgi:hypothetical protein